MASIYGLFDKSGALRYIGKANDPAKRLGGHMRDSRRRNTPLYCWIRKNGQPEMRILHDCGEGEDWRNVERQLIADARADGAKLLNVADGGDEPYCPMEVRQENGRKSAGPNGYLSRVKNEPLLGLVHQIKRDFPAALRMFEKRGQQEAAERMRQRMKVLGEKLPQYFPKWGHS